MGSLAKWLGIQKSKPPSHVKTDENPPTEEKTRKLEVDNLAEQLSAENARLREDLKKLTFQLQAHQTKQAEQSYEESSNDFYKQLESNLTGALEGKTSNESSPSPSCFSSSSAPLTTPLPELIESQSKKAVLVCLPAKEESEEDQVCMVDLSEAEWWTIVESARDREIAREDGETYVECELAAESKTDDDDSYLLVEEKNLGDALSNFVAETIRKKYPEAKALSPKQLTKLIDKSFYGLKEPTTLGRYVKYGHLAYTTYGWGMCVWSLYKDPAMVKLAATWGLRAARWIMILVW